MPSRRRAARTFLADTILSEAAPVFAVFEKPALSEAEGPEISAADLLSSQPFFSPTSPTRNFPQLSTGSECDIQP